MVSQFLGSQTISNGSLRWLYLELREGTEYGWRRRQSSTFRYDQYIENSERNWAQLKKKRGSMMKANDEHPQNPLTSRFQNSKWRTLYQIFERCDIYAKKGFSKLLGLVLNLVDKYGRTIEPENCLSVFCVACNLILGSAVIVKEMQAMRSVKNINRWTPSKWIQTFARLANPFNSAQLPQRPNKTTKATRFYCFAFHAGFKSD